MSDLEILRQKDSNQAEFIERWRSKYGREFDLSNERDQADLFEGIMEMARHVAVASEGATMAVGVNNHGVSGLSVYVTPKEPSQDQDN